MLFNSLDFAIFLPVCFLIYWFLLRDRLQAQNVFLLLASYVFYGWWDWKFLSLIFISTIVDYVIALSIERAKRKIYRKMLLFVSLGVNLGILFFFKYYDFFIVNFAEAFTFFGYAIEARTLNIILPVGISFYTFQTLSYTIDVYREKLKPTRDIIAFGAFVSFFPQLVAGPIERATNLLPQFNKNRKFVNSDATDGMRQILWGLFKKVVIADNSAIFVDHIFSNYETLPGSTLLIGALFFTFQIYGDFSGYSDIAIGTARLFGFRLMQNFAFPYFSRDIAEFWRRWHISLSTWFRDYVYIPLGGSRGGTLSRIRNTIIIFVVSGFWHGANWTFIVWGFLNALYFLPLLLFGKNRKHLNDVAESGFFPTFTDFLRMTMTFSLTVFAWIFFRSDNISMAVNYISTIASSSLFTMPELINPVRANVTIFMIVIFMAVEWLGRRGQYGLQIIGSVRNAPFRWLIYYLIILTIYLLQGIQQQFIYFQF